MIHLENFDIFKRFIDDVKTAAIPFRIVGMQSDDMPLQTYLDQKARPPKSFSVKLLLCSSMATVLFETSFPLEEKPRFNEFAEAFDIQMVNSLELKNGVVFCQ